MALNLGLYKLNTDVTFFFCVCGPERGMFYCTIKDALLSRTTSDKPPSCRQLTPINLIKWSD